MTATIPRVGLMGVQCETANLGLAALTYSTASIINEVVPGEAEIVLFSINSPEELARMSATLGLTNKRLTAVPFRRKRPAAMANSFRQMKRCDVIVDFTGGDSFSDIYGAKRILKKLADKQLVLASGTPFIIAPQTIGPFKHRVIVRWARHVLGRASMVFTRDELSQTFLGELGINDSCAATDVAVTLPWHPSRFDLPTTCRPRVGLNVSGLLWNGGYTGQNQFDLRADYRSYVRGLISSLDAAGFDVHLVPHVISRGGALGEDDVVPSRQLASEFPSCVMAPPFGDPVEAKSYICRMDVFIGSRMHATIAAFTSGVPTVPVAYSRKFAGFFGHLGYPVVVDLTAMDAASAIVTTMDHAHRRHDLAAAVSEGRRAADERIQAFRAGLASLLPG